MQEDKEYYTTKQACDYLGISAATLDRLIKRKVLKKYRRTVDHRVYYKKSELDDVKRFRPRSGEEK